MTIEINGDAAMKASESRSCIGKQKRSHKGKQWLQLYRQVKVAAVEASEGRSRMASVVRSCNSKQRCSLIDEQEVQMYRQANSFV